MSAVSREWNMFKKGSIGKTAGLMTPYENVPVVLFRGDKFAYLSKKALSILGNPKCVAVGVEGRDICMKSCETASEGYRVHGTPDEGAGPGQSAYVDLSLFIKEYGVHMGLYECEVEDGGTLVFNMRDHKTEPEVRNWSRRRNKR